MVNGHCEMCGMLTVHEVEDPIFNTVSFLCRNCNEQSFLNDTPEKLWLPDLVIVGVQPYKTIH